MPLPKLPNKLCFDEFVRFAVHYVIVKFTLCLSSHDVKTGSLGASLLIAFRSPRMENEPAYSSQGKNGSEEETNSGKYIRT